MTRSPSDAGLQAERTGLAWSRTSLAVAGNGALLAVHQLQHAAPTLALLPAGLALAVAVATAVYGRRRTRALRVAPLPSPLASSRAVPVLGFSVALLAVLSGAVVVL